MSYRTTKVPLTKCPTCGKVLDAATAAADGQTPPDAMPEPGNYTVCLGCGEILIFDRRMRAARPTPADWITTPVDVQQALRRVQAAVRSMQKPDA